VTGADLDQQLFAVTHNVVVVARAYVAFGLGIDPLLENGGPLEHESYVDSQQEQDSSGRSYRIPG
jgi:hypothetical protein